MTVRWTPTAARDLESLHAYVAQDHAAAAATVVDRLLAAIEALSRHPDMGRRGRVPSTRELIVPPFVVAYRVIRDAVEILGIIHGARRWPDSF